MTSERLLLVVDLEATCWERSRHSPENMETIEIGALIVDPLRDDVAPREFQCFVRPVRFPQLSEFCTRLTSIRQDDVDGAPAFAESFARFVDWVGDPAAVRFASWGAYDRRQLLQDCAHAGTAYPFGEEHLNLKHWCAPRLGMRPGGLLQALAKAGLTLDGVHHRGLDDARNIWRVTRVAAGDDRALLTRREG